MDQKTLKKSKRTQWKKPLLMAGFMSLISTTAFSQGTWTTIGNSGTSLKLGQTDYEDLNLFTDDALRATITRDGDLGVGRTNPSGRQEIMYCPLPGGQKTGLIVTRQECPGSNVVVFDPNQSDVIGFGLSAGTGTGEGSGTFTLPYSFLTGHTTTQLNPFYGSDRPMLWLRSEKPAGTPTNTSGSDEYDTKFVVMPDGSTGINIAQPRAALDVRGSQTANHPAAIFGSRALGTGNTTSTGLFQYHTQQLHIVPVLQAGGYNAISKDNDQGLFFSDGKGTDGSNLSGALVIAPWSDQSVNPGTGGLKIYKDGDLGVFGHLDVYGNIKSHRLTVKSFSWPDYVFDEDYKLMSLSEVESFIRDKGHLPGVPSEQEVESDGVDVAMMQELLLKKIEELTRYTIEQQKQIEELKRK